MLLARRGGGDAQRAKEMLGQALAAAGKLRLGGVERRAVVLLQDCLMSWSTAVVLSTDLETAAKQLHRRHLED